MLDRFFRISASGSSMKTEILAGGTTFVTMAYILTGNVKKLSPLMVILSILFALKLAL